MKNPLRYEISDWNDLNNCLSNNSQNLFIRVSKLLDPHLTGRIIEVKHSLYGTLFAAVVDASGDMLSNEVDGRIVRPMTVEAILEQLAIYGFYVTYHPEQYLPGSQLLLLMSVQSLGYRLITVLNVDYKDARRQVVVAFNADDCPAWITYGHVISESELSKKLSSGAALNVDAIPSTHSMNWDWLSYVATIEDVLRMNSRIDL